MNQKDINDAVDFLFTQGKVFAKAKAARIYLEEFRKTKKAILMKSALEQKVAKTNAAAEMEAYASSQYAELLSGLRVAVEQEEELRWALMSAQARIDVWRTLEASNQNLDKAVM